jgi:hypothetical protein
MMTATAKAFTTALVVAILPLGIGCFGGSSTPATTHLRIAFGPDDGSAGLVVFRVSCNPARGTVPEPPDVCAALKYQPALTSPSSANRTCGGIAGAWAVSVTGAKDGRRVHVRFGVCDEQVTQWMQITRYMPCPSSFLEFTCSHGPYAFGKAHMRGLYVSVPNVVGKTATEATRVLRQHGLQANFATPLLSHDEHLVAAQSPRARATADVYQAIKLTLNKGCGFC